MAINFRKPFLIGGSLGKITRWVGENYIKYKDENPDLDELDIRIFICNQRYAGIDTHPFKSNNLEHIQFTSRVKQSLDLHDLVIAIYRLEIGTRYDTNQKKMRLMYEVIFQELTLLGIPRNIAFVGA